MGAEKLRYESNKVNDVTINWRHNQTLGSAWFVLSATTICNSSRKHSVKRRHFFLGDHHAIRPMIRSMLVGWRWRFAHASCLGALCHFSCTILLTVSVLL